MRRKTKHQLRKKLKLIDETLWLLGEFQKRLKVERKEWQEELDKR